MPAIDLSKSPIHLPSDSKASAVILENFGFDGPAFEAYIDAHCSDDQPGRIVMIETSPVDWPIWECHPLGDELVIILSGEGDFIHETPEGEVRMAVSAGDTVLNPAGVWHTADVREPIRAVYLTPAPGTDHKPRG